MPSEDPILCGEYGAAYISAFQSRNLLETPLLAAATAKHWAFYDLEGFVPRVDVHPRPPSATCDSHLGDEGAPGCERFNMDAFPPMDQATLYYMAPFKPLIDAQIASVMCRCVPVSIFFHVFSSRPLHFIRHHPNIIFFFFFVPVTTQDMVSPCVRPT